ncbi:uncharacterized protein LOC125063518 [Pieris napi]|uniref:uncharacterized protein LOC125063518 n=1 Tax=Pieris napi TaxID=78633 RepID=UPI001FBBF618|nr:uncharacterized protein LOC125063518 [Pieris napi]
MQTAFRPTQSRGSVIINSLPRIGSAHGPKLRSETAHMVSQPPFNRTTVQCSTDIILRGQRYARVLKLVLCSAFYSYHSLKGERMSKPSVTNFSKRTGSPFQKIDQEKDEQKIVHEEVLHKTNYEKQKEKSEELVQKVSKKAAEYHSNKPSSGVFTEVVTHGAFTTKKVETEKPKENQPLSKNNNGNSKPLLGFPSSANDLALDAKTDLESDPNISKEIREKVIDKLFTLVSMVQHTYESKVRIMTEFERFKDTHLKNDVRREKEHSEQLYKLNINFQSEVIQAIQQLRSELDLSRNLSSNLDDSNLLCLKDSDVKFSSLRDCQSDNSDSQIDYNVS